MAIFWPTPGFKGRTFELCVLNRWDLISASAVPCCGVDREGSMIVMKSLKDFTWIDFERRLTLKVCSSPRSASIASRIIVHAKAMEAHCEWACSGTTAVQSWNLIGWELVQIQQPYKVGTWSDENLSRYSSSTKLELDRIRTCSDIQLTAHVLLWLWNKVMVIDTGVKVSSLMEFSSCNTKFETSCVRTMSPRKANMFLFVSFCFSMNTHHLHGLSQFSPVKRVSTLSKVYRRLCPCTLVRLSCC